MEGLETVLSLGTIILGIATITIPAVLLLLVIKILWSYSKILAKRANGK